ncbi:STM4015 family protein [Streptomyces sp. SM14]|uniref:STM4015 family protein n=1 Tax=Streptomyces sp. SM14 TaxID=1736045 RepID=UPI000CD50037|nr:STM4015 family protein [Streptomyces sp. SM14]
MTVHDHLVQFHRLPVRDFGGPEADHAEVADHGAVAWRIAVEPYGDDPEEFTDAFQRFTEVVDLTQVRALVIGQWGEAYEQDSSLVAELLAGVKERLTALRALFVGDLVMEEAEISWIEQSDLTVLLEAFPQLEELGIRGGTKLALRPVRHEALRSLTIETGGLPGEVTQAVSDSDFPALESLTLWLGQENYGGTTTPEHLAGILSGTRLPALRRLALQNADEQDAVAVALATAPVLPRLLSLDLSLGALTDTGAQALLDGQTLAGLEELNLSYHYLSEEMERRFEEAMEAIGVEVDLSDRQEPEEYRGQIYRYSAIGE